MAGTPLKRALIARIRERGGYSVVLERVANGETLTVIARDYGVSRQLLRKVLTRGKTSEITEQKLRAYEEAKKAAAEAIVDEAGEILDNASILSREDVAKAKHRAEHRRWLAGVLDRETFGESKTQGPTLNIGQMFLSALQAPPPARPALPQASTPAPSSLPVKPAELVEEISTDGPQAE